MEDILRRGILSAGPLPFERFLEVALYDPEHGYYASGKAGVGFENADFFTNVSCGPAFGKILALEFEKLWRSLGCPRPFLLIEQGANDGRLAADILNSASTDQPLFYEAVRMRLIEPTPILRHLQKQTLARHAERLEFADDAAPGRPAPGIFYCNELVDALPFALLAHDGAGWKEKRVGIDNSGNFCFVRVPIDRPDLADAVAKLPIPPCHPYETEVRPAIAPWLGEATGALSRGAVFIFDYGFKRDDYYAAHRRTGTMLCYQSHRRDENPLESIGEKDISAHVDFTALVEAACALGLREIRVRDQHHFLVEAAAGWLRSLDGAPPDAESARLLRNFKMLMHPETLGRKFLAFSARIDRPGQSGASGRKARPMP